MYYYYDVLLNFGSDDNMHEFYEWTENDPVEYVKKIPLFRVPTGVLIDNLKYQTKYEETFLNQIKNKTILKSNREEKVTTFIISDAKNALALELDNNGVVISRSRLLPSDELNLSEAMFTMQESDLTYEKLNEYKNKTSLRQEREIKSLILCEIDTLYKSNQNSKLKYLYYEWFNKSSDNIEKIYKEMMDSLQKEYNNNLKKVYDFIKLSYHNMG